MYWQDIEEFPNIHYRVNVPLMYLLENLERYVNEQKLDLNPDFQRGHVWSEKQQIEYMEFVLKKPQSGLEIYFNHPNWMGNWKGNFVLVDGKQRLNAAIRFLKNEIPAFGCFLKDFKFKGYEKKENYIPFDIDFHFNIAKLKTRADVLNWYINFNAGGTPHSQEEIQRVKELLKEESKKKD
jgi:uncharacterized protein with ParB-like and HNH nuclease domain